MTLLFYRVIDKGFADGQLDTGYYNMNELV